MRGEAIDRSAHTSPQRGRRTPPGRDRGKPSGGGVAEKTRDPRIPPLAKRGDLLPLGRGFAKNRKNPGHGAKVGLPRCRPWEKTPAERGTHCLPVGVPYA